MTKVCQWHDHPFAEMCRKPAKFVFTSSNTLHYVCEEHAKKCKQIYSDDVCKTFVEVSEET